MPGTNLFAPPDYSGVKVALSNEVDNAILAKGTAAQLPSAVAGYAVGCLYIATDTGNLYLNTGTTTSATFTLVDTATTSLQLPEAATDATTTTTTSLALTQNAVTTGAGLTQSLNGLTTGKGHSITHTTSVIASGGSLLNLSSTGVDTATTSGALLNLTSTLGVAATQILGTFGTTTGIGASIVTDALTTGTALSLTNASGVMTTNGEMLLVSADAATTSTGLARISGAGLTTGNVTQLNATAATLTTGRYLSANDGALEVFGVGANGHLHTSQTTAPTIAVSQQNGITAAAITAGASDVNGIITTTGTNNNGGTSILQVTFHKTYTTAPKAVMLTARNASGAGPNPPYISDITATTFDITIPASASAGATPSWNYLVIA